jgi:mono/diheme cytochrome c family protein
MLEALNRMLPRFVLAAGCLVLVQGPVFAADANQGKAIAERWCVSCHVVKPGQKSAVTDQAPPFASLAGRPDFSADRLAFLLLKPHPNMPPLALSRIEVSNLADYIQTLK